SDKRPSQAEELRGAARAAIPSLVAAVTGINDRRAGRSDRAADLRALALWFAEAEDDQAAHRLWRGAFALDSCRHLSIDADTLDQRGAEPVSSTTRWIDAPPVRISPRLHNSGRYAARGRPLNVIDRSAERAKLGLLALQEAGEISQWWRILGAGRRVRLSQLDELPEGAFQLFLDVLADALAAKSGSAAAVSVTSSDGVLQIDLEPTEDGAMAVIRATAGVLIGEDHYLMIRPLAEDGEEADDAWRLEVPPSLVAEG
ncbi:MAG: TIGR02677 family protein, partial [Gammaproteobacteria bacterium]